MTFGTGESLNEIVARTKLKIRVGFFGPYINVSSRAMGSRSYGDARSASHAYLTLCAAIQRLHPEPFDVPAATSLAGPAAPIAESRSAPGAVE